MDDRRRRADGGGGQQSPPAWIDQEAAAQSSEQRYRAPVIETSLVSDRPVDVQLLGVVSGQRAARSEVAGGAERDARGTVRAVHRGAARFGAAAELEHADRVAAVGDGAEPGVGRTRSGRRWSSNAAERRRPTCTRCCAVTMPNRSAARRSN